MPASVASIDANAFQDCTGLTSVGVEKNSGLTSIGDGAFAGCTALKTASFAAAKNLTSVGSGIFDASVLSAKVKKATAKKGRKLAVKWAKTLGATRYVLYYKAAGAKKYSKKSVAGTSKTLTKLKAGKKYSTYVVAYLGTAKLCKSAVKKSAKVKK